MANSYLLLLPHGPSDSGFSSYKAPIRDALKRASAASVSASSATSSVLDIAVWCPEEFAPPRSRCYDAYQHLLAGVYRAGCHASGELGLDAAQASGYVDFRVYLITGGYGQVNDGNTREDCDSTTTGNNSSDDSTSGPLFSVRVLARCARDWRETFVPADHANNRSVREFADIRRATGRQGGVHLTQVTASGGMGGGAGLSSYKATNADLQPHVSVIVGGTFDNLHEGHKLLLSCLALVLEPAHGTLDEFERSRKITVGITGDQLLKNKKYASVLESWDERQAATFRFLASVLSLDDSVAEDLVPERREGDPEVPNSKVCSYKLPSRLTLECVEIQDPFGPTITDEAVSALVVSAETREGGRAVNERREAKGWRPLQTFEVELLAAEDTSDDLQDKISSTEKRRRKVEAAAAASSGAKI